MIETYVAAAPPRQSHPPRPRPARKSIGRIGRIHDPPIPFCEPFPAHGSLIRQFNLLAQIKRSSLSRVGLKASTRRPLECVVMKKLRRSVDDLHIESFATDEGSAPVGTVHGQGLTNYRAQT